MMRKTVNFEGETVSSMWIAALQNINAENFLKKIKKR